MSETKTKDGPGASQNGHAETVSATIEAPGRYKPKTTDPAASRKTEVRIANITAADGYRNRFPAKVEDPDRGLRDAKREEWLDAVFSAGAQLFELHGMTAYVELLQKNNAPPSPADLAEAVLGKVGK